MNTVTAQVILESVFLSSSRNPPKVNLLSTYVLDIFYLDSEDSTGSFTSLSTAGLSSFIGSLRPCLNERTPCPKPFISSGSFLPPKRRSTSPPIRSSSVVPIIQGTRQNILPSNIINIIEIVEVINVVVVVIVIIIIAIT